MVHVARVLALTMLLCFVCLDAAPNGDDAQARTTSAVLSAAARYVASFKEDAPAVAFSEEYIQLVTRMEPRAFGERRLRSDIVMINTDDFGWIGRDVTHVDGKAVLDRPGRLRALFAPPRPLSDAVALALEPVDESLQFNLGTVPRTLNYPTTALAFLRRVNQDRSSFSGGRTARVDGVVTWTFTFQEIARPTLLGTTDQAAMASGQFWVDSQSGRVWRSQITVEEDRAVSRFDVLFGPSAGFGVLMPLSMQESVSVRAGTSTLERGLVSAGDIRPIEVIRGEAQYSNFRRLDLDAQTDVLSVPTSQEP